MKMHFMLFHWLERYNALHLSLLVERLRSSHFLSITLFRSWNSFSRILLIENLKCKQRFFVKFCKNFKNEKIMDTMDASISVPITYHNTLSVCLLILNFTLSNKFHLFTFWGKSDRSVCVGGRGGASTAILCH